MRHLCFLFILLNCLISCTSEQKDPEQENKTESQTTVPEERENNNAAANPEDTLRENSAAKPFIVPGKSIGLINLNEDAEVVHKLLGEPASSNSGMGKSLQTWKLKTADGKDYQLSIFFGRNMGNADEKSRAKQIRITSAAFINEKQEATTTSTLRGNIQNAKKMLIYTLPGLKGQFEIYDNLNTGIAFEFDPSGNVIAITIHEPGKAAFEIFSEVSSNLKKTKPSEQNTLPFPGIKD